MLKFSLRARWLKTVLKQTGSLHEEMEDLNDYLDLLEAVPASVLHEKIRKQFSLAAYCRLD